jgi:anti-sigma regulatory factor (Ser/Thr protein kinase)
MLEDKLAEPDTDQVRGAVSDASQVAEVRRAAAAVAARAGFDQTTAGRVAIVVTELASNLVKHAKDGEVFLRRVRNPGGTAVGVEAISLDTGPGIANVGKALQDGYSTAGSPGAGLGAVQRLATEFDLYSLQGRGTGMLARLWDSRALLQEGAVKVGAVKVPARYERVCGDDWTHRPGPRYHTLVVADGLGHGESAAIAARATLQVVDASFSMRPGRLLQAMHERLRSTRGAAVLVVQIDLVDRIVRHAGIGNVSGVLLSNGGRPRHMVSQNGIVGHEAGRIHEIETPCPGDWTLVLHSDGISSRWDLDQYPGLLARDPSLIAAVLYRDHKRGRDDATVVVAKGVGQ